MRVIICDDDEFVRRRLHDNIKLAFKSMRKSGYPGLLECDEFDNGKDLLEDNGEKNLVFLDIEMPGADGISVGRALKQADSDVLIAYVTSHTEYLDDAMSFCVFRYISKPLNQERIVKCICDALNILCKRRINVVVDEGNCMCRKVNTYDIVMVEKDARRLKLHMKDGEVIRIMGTINDFMIGLNPLIFAMCHRSFIINFKYVSKIDKNTVYLCGGKYMAYLSRNRYTSIKEAFINYVEKAV